MAVNPSHPLSLRGQGTYGLLHQRQPFGETLRGSCQGAPKLPASYKPEPLITRAQGLCQGRGTAGLSPFLMVGSREFPWEGARGWQLLGCVKSFFSSQIQPGMFLDPGLG